MKITESLGSNYRTADQPNMLSRWILKQKSIGISYVYAWLHRFCGLGLLLFLWVHLYTISLLANPIIFDSKIAWLNQIGLYHLEWMLALPVIFHALNGGRLILYEIFNRQERLLGTWVVGLSILYTFMILLIVYSSNFSVRPSMWIITWLLGMGVAGIVILGTLPSKIGVPWKLQRISGGFLLVMIPIHMVLMHANPMAGHDAVTIITRIQSSVLIKVVDGSIAVSALYHGAYGLVSIAKDYLKSSTLIQIVIILTTMVCIVLGWLGINTIAGL